MKKKISVTRKRHRRRNYRRNKKSKGFKFLKPAIFLLGIMIIFIIIYENNSRSDTFSSDGYYHNEKFKNHIIVKGIDVSYAQGNNINWKALKKSGVDFVFIRAGYRGADSGKLHKDERFDTNIINAKKKNLMVGAYIYSQAISEKEAVEEAKFLKKLARKYKIDLPMTFDYEIYEGGRLEKAFNNGTLSKDKATKIALAFSDEIINSGFEPLIYGNKNFLSWKMDGKKLSKNTNVWVAQYNKRNTYKNDYQFWQASDRFKFNHIKHKFDLNFWYVNKKSGYSTLGKRPYFSRTIKNCIISLDKHNYIHNGSPICPKITIYDGKKPLNEGTDFTVSYAKNINSGTGYIIINGIGTYKDQVVESFLIK